MADKKAATVSEEKVFMIPLRSKFTPATRITKTKKSVSAVKEYILRHTRANAVTISPLLNDKLWASGAKNPLKSVNVKVILIDNIANARLPEEITLEEEKKKYLEEKGKKKSEVKVEEKETENVAAPEGEKPEESKTEEKSTEEKKDEPEEAKK